MPEEENSECVSTPAVTNVLSGRRIVDIVYLFTQIQNEKHHGGSDCSFMDMDFVKEKVDGFHCDGDSSVHRKLLETMPYSPNLMVEKVECKNHVLRNYCHKLTDLTNNRKLPVTSRNLLKHQIPRFRTAVDKAIKYRVAGNEPLNTRICMLKADVENSPLHIFGDHEHYDVYFCDGKRINYVLREQYKTRSAAAISFNNVGEYMRVIHKTMMGGNSPGIYTKKFVDQQKRARENRKHQSTKGTQYGIANEPVAKRNMAEEHGIVAIEFDLLEDSEYPFLGATPDAIMEAKCPLSADKYGSPTEAVDSIQMSYCTIVNGKLLLRRDSNYYQVQGQFHISGRKYSYFVVYTSQWMAYEVIEKDDEFWNDRMAQSLCR
ncbi:hypothetical protein PR048_014764 [Dryococelus australis]|uniref:YqaJ viral recombinase domain-containing protein n=1 Tax=Dryococelus australis TaxID=614101 RepID=A0ABQ9HFA6_9NEOP|nr:hypothetical protein PR048_014764 [Dryococelus australis]